MSDKLSLLSGQALVVWLLIVAAGLLAFYSFLYRREGRHVGRLSTRQAVLLWILRSVVAALALVAIARPAVRLVHYEDRLPVVGLLVDESASMAFPAARGDPLTADLPKDARTRFESAQQALARMQERLTATHRVKVYGFSDTVHLIKELPHRAKPDEPALGKSAIFPSDRKADGEYSNIGEAVQDVLRELSGEKVSGLVVASDFRLTGGAGLDRLAELAKAAGVPLHVVVEGTEFPLRDLRIDEVAVGPEANLGDVLTFHLKVTNQISEGLEPKLTLFEEGKEVASKRPKLKRGDNTVSIAAIPQTQGTREFRLELEPQEDEINLDNNKAAVHVNVVKRGLRVILVAGRPTLEYFYLTPALLRDPIVSVSCYLQAADIDYVQQGNVNIERLPRTLKEWQVFDVAILYDVDPNGITDQQIAALEAMVNKGGGLLVIAGRNHGLAKLVQVHATRIRSLLPVEIDKNQYLDHDTVYDKPFVAQRTPAGRNHPIMLASTDLAGNEKLWESFPKFYWHHPVAGLKSQAISLLERKDEQGSATPLMAIQRYGEGAVFFSAIDSMWRWRYPGESYDYDRFWTRVIRYLGETRLHGSQQQVALSTDRRSYSPGEKARISLRILDPALMNQLAGQSVFAALTSPAKDRHMLQLRPPADGSPVYQGDYEARALGSMLVQVRQVAAGSDSEQKPLFDVKAGFEVKLQSLEDKDTSADLRAAAELAAATGGQCLDYRSLRTPKDLDAIASAIPAAPQRLEKTLQMELWDGGYFLALFLVLISGEWCLRKLWGLL